MLNTESEIDSPTELDTRPTGLRLQFPNGSRIERQMPSVRSTIGSGAGCSIPVRYPGVSPLHCVLFPSSAGWRIRRWSAETKLNGESFSESSVEVGDRLQVGPVEIEFTGYAEPAIRAGFDSANPSENVIHEERHEVAVKRGPGWEDVETLVNEAISKQSHEVEQLRDRVTTGFDRIEKSLDEWRDRLREFGEKLSLVDQSRESTSEVLTDQARQMEELRNQLAPRSERLDDIGSNRTEICDRLTAIGNDLTQLKQQYESIPETLAEQDRRLETIRVQSDANSGLQDQLRELRQEMADDKQVQSEIPARFAELEQQLDQLRNRIEDEFCRKEQWEGSHNYLDDRMTELRQELTNVGQLQKALQEAESGWENELEALRAQIVAVIAQDRKSDSERSELREKFDELQNESKSDKERLAACYEATADQARRLEEALNQVAATSSQYGCLDESLNELRERFEGLAQESARVQSLRADDRDAMAELQRDLNEIRDEPASVPVERQRIESDLSELRSALQAIREELVASQQFQASMPETLVEQSRQLESLQSQIAAVSSQNEQFGAGLTELRERSEMSSNSATGQTNATELVQETLTQHGRELEELREQIASASLPSSDLHTELKSLREELQELRIDRARDEQLQMATRDAVVELERQLAERVGQNIAAPVGRSVERASDDDWKPNESLGADTIARIETEVERDTESAGSPPSECIATQTESYQEPESFLNKYQHLLAEDEPETIESDDDSTTTSLGALAIQDAPIEANEAAQVGTAEDEDSIEDYMGRLLQRVRGGTCEIAAKSSSKAPTEEPVVSSTEPPPKPTVKPVSNLEEIRAAPAPERSRDMKALRNLANESARNSLHESKVRKSREYAILKLFVSVFAIVCGYIVIGLSPSYTSPEFLGGLVPVIVGVIWGGKMIVIILQAIRIGSFENLDSQNESPSEIPVELSADEL